MKPYNNKHYHRLLNNVTRDFKLWLMVHHLRNVHDGQEDLRYLVRKMKDYYRNENLKRIGRYLAHIESIPRPLTPENVVEPDRVL